MSHYYYHQYHFIWAGLLTLQIELILLSLLSLTLLSCLSMLGTALLGLSDRVYTFLLNLGSWHSLSWQREGSEMLFWTFLGSLKVFFNGLVPLENTLESR